VDDLAAPKPSGRPAVTAEPDAPPPGSPADRSTAFKPVEGVSEIQSGERLLVEAYAAIWIIVFVFLVFSWRRQRALDDRVAALEGAIARAKKSGGG
jgi:CcmD family protein